MSAHDVRHPGEQWFWLVPVSDEAFARDRSLVEQGKRFSLGVTSLPALQRPGDLVVYYGSDSGMLVGVGEVADEPRRQQDEHGLWRVRVTPHVILENDRAPSLASTGIRASGRPRSLEPAEYERIRELMASIGAGT